MGKKILMFILLSLNLLSGEFGTGGKVGSKVFVFLIWELYKGATGYNIFRKASISSPYPETPINSTPIMKFTNCASFDTSILPVSEKRCNKEDIWQITHI